MPVPRTFPVLDTSRLTLRQFQLIDAPRVKELAGVRELAETTFMPHPYKEGEAEMWIMNQYEDFKRRQMVNFAMELKASCELIGSIGLDLELAHQRAQMGFWVGLPYWNKGYCTEAASRVLEFGFTAMKLNRIYASHFTTNPASGHVLKKIGMHHEGTQEQHYVRFDKFVGVENYGIVRAHFDSQSE